MVAPNGRADAGWTELGWDLACSNTITNGCACAVLQQAFLRRDDHRSQPALDFQLVHDMSDVVARGDAADAQPCGNLDGAQPVSEQTQDFALTGSEERREQL